MGYGPALSTSFFSDEKILNMESNLLFDRFDDDRTFQELQENIRTMVCGRAMFQKETLGFVYHRLMTRKRHAIREPRATLHCARYLYAHVYALSELHDGLYCPECDECGRNGKGRPGRPFTRCGGCNKLRDTRGLRCSLCNVAFKSY